MARYRRAIAWLLGIVVAELGVVDYALIKGFEVEMEQAEQVFEADLESEGIDVAEEISESE